MKGTAMTSEEFREGHYKDKYGRWQPDRRSGGDRRLLRKDGELAHERRRMYRRKADREIFEKDHRAMINDALEEFAGEHGGHL